MASAKRNQRAPEVDLRDVVQTDVGPYHIVLAVLVYMYADFVHKQGQAAFADPVEDEEYKAGEIRLRKLLLRLVKGGLRVWQPSLDELLQMIDREVGGTALAGMMKQELHGFIEGMNYPDDLLNHSKEYFEQMTCGGAEARRLAGDNGGGDWLEPQTELGQFVRAVALAIKSRQFEALCLLFEDLQLYGGSLVTPRTQAPRPAGGTAGGNPQRERRRALEHLVAHHVKAADQGTQSLEPDEIDALTRSLESVAPDLALVHRLRHCLAMQQNDHTTAVEALQRYFDYSHGPAAKEGGEGSQSRFSSALLNLGATYVHFGESKNAMLALNETVRVAQQVGDDTILQHALSQLCRLLAGSPPSATEEGGHPPDSPAYFAQLFQLLQRCHKRSAELQLPHLEAYARLALAKFRWQHCMRPAEPLDHLGNERQVSGLEDCRAAVKELEALSHATRVAAAAAKPAAAPSKEDEAPPPHAADLYPSQAPVFNPDLAGREEAVAATVEQLAGSAHLLHSAACLLAGDLATALSSVHRFLTNYAATAREEDCCLAYAQLAYSAAERQGCDAARKVLAVAEQMQSGTLRSRQLTVTRLAIDHSRALCRGDYYKAEDLAHQIVAAAGPVKSLNMAIRVEGERRLVETWIRQQRIEEAEEKARSIFESCQEAGLQGEATQMLLTLCELHRACNASPSALPYALACHKHASNLGHNLLAAEARLHVADLQMELGLAAYSDCHANVIEVMPLVLGNGSLRLQGLLYWTLAMLTLKDWRSSHKLAEEKNRVLNYLGQAAQAYQKQEDWQRASQCYYFVATVEEALGEQQARDSAADSWRRFKALHESTQAEC